MQKYIFILTKKCEHFRIVILINNRTKNYTHAKSKSDTLLAHFVLTNNN